MNAHNDETSESERPLSSNSIVANVTEEAAEYAGCERMYAVLFAEDPEGISFEANGDVAVLLDREQMMAARETLDEVVTELEAVFAKDD